MELNYRQKAESWLTDGYDEKTREDVLNMIKGNPKELEESFYRNLEFGTGGLRGVMGVGTNRMNRYTVAMATQGLATYIKKSFPLRESLSVAVAFDSRNNSKYFAQVTADVFAANDIDVFIFNELRPTPQLSFTMRNQNCVAGVMITASHNPKEYNGYKAYWDDGAQVTAPHDTNIIDEVQKIEDISQVKFNGGTGKITTLGVEADEAYLNAILSLTLSPEYVEKHNSFKIVYTPLHGTGVKLVPEALKRAGFNNIIHVPEQDVSDGNFPTIISPNPEESAALKMALEKAAETGADLVMATDPDADRLGIAVRNDKGELVLLNGNQTASILTYYILERRRQLKKLGKECYMVKTIVTTDLLKSMADAYGVEIFNVLTGFKYIAEIVKQNEGFREFIGGGEESYGFNVGEFVRDKDAVISCCLVAEAAAWAADSGRTLYDLLMDIYAEFGYYKESLISVTKKGKDGLEQIQKMMTEFRTKPLQNLDGSPVVLFNDFLSQESIDLISDLRHNTNLPKSNVLQFISSDNSIVSVRPSGTEPKIKFYFGVKTKVNSRSELPNASLEMDEKLSRLAKQLAG